MSTMYESLEINYRQYYSPADRAVQAAMGAGVQAMVVRTATGAAGAVMPAAVMEIVDRGARVAMGIAEAALVATAMEAADQVLRDVTAEEVREDLAAVRERHVPDSGIPAPRALIRRSRQNLPATVKTTIITRMTVMIKRM